MTGSAAFASAGGAMGVGSVVEVVVVVEVVLVVVVVVVMEEVVVVSTVVVVELVGAAFSPSLQDVPVMMAITTVMTPIERAKRRVITFSLPEPLASRSLHGDRQRCMQECRYRGKKRRRVAWLQEAVARC